MNLRTIGNFNVKTIINGTSHDISRQIEEFFDGRSKNDLLLMFFSGHGIKDDEGLLHFAVSDTRIEMVKLKVLK